MTSRIPKEDSIYAWVNTKRRDRNGEYIYISLSRSDSSQPFTGGVVSSPKELMLNTLSDVPKRQKERAIEKFMQRIGEDT